MYRLLDMASPEQHGEVRHFLTELPDRPATRLAFNRGARFATGARRRHALLGRDGRLIAAISAAVDPSQADRLDDLGDSSRPPLHELAPATAQSVALSRQPRWRRGERATLWRTRRATRCRWRPPAEATLRDLTDPPRAAGWVDEVDGAGWDYGASPATGPDAAEVSEQPVPLPAGVPRPLSLDVQKSEDEHGGGRCTQLVCKVAGPEIPAEDRFNFTHVKGVAMALSDDLTKLAARAKEAEDRLAAAQKCGARQGGTRRPERAGVAPEEHGQLRQTAETNKGKVAAWWSDVQKSWDEHIASIRRDIESKKAEHDVEGRATKG